MRPIGTFTIPNDHPSLEGHFPDRPIVPGVVLLDEIVALIHTVEPGPINTLPTIRFTRPVRPGDTVHVTYERGAFAGTVAGHPVLHGKVARTPPPPLPMTWSTQRERGSPAILRAAIFLALNGGRLAAPLLVWPATAWFLLTSTKARQASRDYLRRALDRPARLPDVARHFHSFACAVLDRVLLLAGQNTAFDLETHGLETVNQALALGRGCILLGAHLGSFEVLRTVARHAPVPVWALMYRRNQGALTPLLDRLAPHIYDHVLEIGDTASMIKARECVERGEIVGILADRAPPGHRMVTAPFFNELAAFPSGPFVLASTLGAPVILFHAVRTAPRRYDVQFQPFTDRVVLNRATRAADLRQVITRYAAALETSCRAYPYQWFNFFPFWEPAPNATPDPSPPRPDRPASLLSTGHR